MYACVCLWRFTRLAHRTPFVLPTSTPLNLHPLLPLVSPLFDEDRKTTHKQVKIARKKHLEMYKNVLGVFGLYSFLSCLFYFVTRNHFSPASTTTFLLFASQRASLWSSLLSAIILLHRIQNSTLAVIRHPLCAVIAANRSSNIWLFKVLNPITIMLPFWSVSTRNLFIGLF